MKIDEDELERPESNDVSSQEVIDVEIFRSLDPNYFSNKRCKFMAKMYLGFADGKLDDSLIPAVDMAELALALQPPVKILKLESIMMECFQ